MCLSYGLTNLALMTRYVTTCASPVLVARTFERRGAEKLH